LYEDSMFMGLKYYSLAHSFLRFTVLTNEIRESAKAPFSFITFK